MAEKEFIERGAVSKKIDALEVPVFYADGNLDCYQEGFKDALKQVVEILENQPVANVQEIRHGEWIKTKNERECSLCGYFYFANNINFNFCPHCGAKMDKE